MEHIPILEEIAIIAAAAVVVALAFVRLKLPLVAGLLFSGAVLGPFGFHLVSDTHALEVIAEVGVVLLLFTIGLEFSLSRLARIFRSVALGGVLQVGVTIAATTAIALALSATFPRAVFFGFVFALSSTAIVLRALMVRRELDAPHGRFIVGVLIFQDLCVVPMVLLVPLLGGDGEGGAAAAVGLALAKAAGVVIFVLAVSRVVVPKVFGWVEASGSRETFLLAVVALCVGTAWLTSLAGLSLALGAFLAGMIVADTEYSHRAMGDMLPLRDVFVSIFFVSLGMFFDIGVLVEHPILVLLLLVGFVIGKGVIATAAALVMGFPARAAWLAGVGLAQFGEFGFVLVKLGTDAGLVVRDDVDALLNAGILSMFLTPLLAARAPHITAGERLLAPLARLLGTEVLEERAADAEEALTDHVVIVGYGIAGELMANALRGVGTPHVVLELNAENVRRGQAAGDPVYYADATSEEALAHAGIERARCVAVLINDAQAAYRVVDTVNRVAPNAAVIIRTRYLAERDALEQLGAHSIVAEELEGGIEVLARIMREMDAPRNVIDSEVRRARARTQASVRQSTVPRSNWADVTRLSALKVESVLVVEGSRADGKTIREMDLRASTGALVVAVERGDDLITHPGPDDVVAPGDVAYLLGDNSAVQLAMSWLGEPAPDEMTATEAAGDAASDGQAAEDDGPGDE
jgi:CPA2 family monovalent cation:H+ antiporter-2